MHGVALSFGLVVDKRDGEGQRILKCSNYFAAGVVDNASAEVKAVADALGLPVGRCGAHSFSLSHKFAFRTGKSRKEDKLLDARSIFEQVDDFSTDDDNDDTNDIPLEATPGSTLRVAQLYADAGRMAKLNKISRHGIVLLSSQKREGVAEPRPLVSRNPMRWHNAGAAVARACELEHWLADSYDAAGTVEGLLAKYKLNWTPSTGYR